MIEKAELHASIGERSNFEINCKSQNPIFQIRFKEQDFSEQPG